MDSDGKNVRQLVAWSRDLNRTGTRIVSRVLTYEWRLSRTLDDGSDDVIVYRSGVDSSDDPYAVRPSRLNTTTGVLRDLGVDLPPLTSRWVMDSKGAIRVVTVQRNGRFKLMWRPKADAPWETLEDQDQTENAGIAPFVPLALDGEDEVVVEGRWQRDTSALYSCKPLEKRWAASRVGVTDLFLRCSAEGDLSSQARRFSLPTLMGHPERDAAQFRATSPVLRAAEIKVPVLLAQAIHDRRVPPAHADAFEKAARAAGVQVQRINYDEGHGWSDFNNHADYLRQLEAFIQRAMGP